MKYPRDAEKCSSTGCTERRRPGQRDCKRCHALAQRMYRRSQAATLKRLEDLRYSIPVLGWVS